MIDVPAAPVRYNMCHTCITQVYVTKKFMKGHRSQRTFEQWVESTPRSLHTALPLQSESGDVFLKHTDTHDTRIRVAQPWIHWHGEHLGRQLTIGWKDRRRGRAQAETARIGRTNRPVHLQATHGTRHH